MEMRTYHCMNQEENPLPYWMTVGAKKKEEKEPEDLVTQFKRNPNAFFPSPIPPGKPRHK